MKLLAVLGATKVAQCQRYMYEQTVYEEYFSFLALAKAKGIGDEAVYVMGTPDTLAMLKQPEFAIAPIIQEQFIEVDDSVDALFERCMGLIEEETILDLTQGFRHLPMTLLLSGLAAASHKRLGGIYYAKADSLTCKPNQESCAFTFISLQGYVDRSNLDAIIDNFRSSWVVPKLPVSLRAYIPIQALLQTLSRHLMSNDLEQAIAAAAKLEQLLQTLKGSEVKNSLIPLEQEIQTIAALAQAGEARRLYLGARLYFQKSLHLHAMTNLFEGVLALMDERIAQEKLPFSYYDPKIRGNKPCKEYRNPYKRRNCLKKALEGFIEKSKKPHPLFNAAFQTKLKQLDKMRNNSAHAHATEKAEHAYAQELGALFVFYGPHFA